MPRSRILRALCIAGMILLALIILALAVAVYQGRRTSTGMPEYVALGSSFAAGADLGPLQTGSPVLCARSVNGYPQRLARMRRLSIVDMTCGGAVTRHLLRGGQDFQGPQVRAIDARTRLVTITVGGNDIGYIGDLSLLAARNDHTLFGWLARSLWSGPKPAAGRDWATLKAEFLATLKTIHARAPKATVVVATYPAILPTTGTCPRLGLTVAEADLMRQVSSRLATVTRAAAGEGGAVLVDMNALGAAHDACSLDPWTRGWTNGGAAPFHPTQRGAQATAEAVGRVVGE